MRCVLEVTLDVPTRLRAAAEAAAYALGAQGLELREGARGRSQVVTWMPTAAARTIVAAVRARVDADVRVRRVPATWLTPPAPRPIGKRFVVIDLDAKAPRGRIPIRVDAALGFGDGAHPTTALCLEAIERTRARRVLDVGTGTGILAIAAAKRGAEVVATDIDPLARDAARRAVRANDVAVRVQARLPRARFDLVVANLYLEPLVALAGDLAARADNVVASGFTHGAPVRAAFAAHGLEVARETTREGWLCLELTRRR